MRLYDLAMAPQSRPSCAVIIPSFRRPGDLARCLAALAAQTRRPEEIIVVLRTKDGESKRAIGEATMRDDITVVLVQASGQVAALNAGAAHVHSDITAIIDDDCAPHSDWLCRLDRHFSSPSVAAVGGRDVIVVGPPDTLVSRVGRLSPCGRPIGNHHKGCGPAREVDFLKGANMAFRTEWVRRFGFDDRLRGSGAQVHNDLRLSLQVRRAGGVLVYDPAVSVDHHAAPRKVGGDRAGRTWRIAFDSSHNEAVAILSGVPPVRVAGYFLWSVLWGTRRNPGLVLALLLLIKQGPHVVLIAGGGIAGRACGLRTALRSV
jgi:cellulose synthase/poly-beta-1,6-N-acetylglucosamine synthase-like glycosyltransferase